MFTIHATIRLYSLSSGIPATDYNNKTDGEVWHIHFASFYFVCTIWCMWKVITSYFAFYYRINVQVVKIVSNNPWFSSVKLQHSHDVSTVSINWLLSPQVFIQYYFKYVENITGFRFWALSCQMSKDGTAYLQFRERETYTRFCCFAKISSSADRLA